MFDQPRVEITKCDNGWVVTWWEDDGLHYLRPPPQPKITTRKEIFTEFKKMMKFVESKL